MKLTRLSVDTRRQLFLFVTGLILAGGVGLLVPGLAQETWEYSIIAESFLQGDGGLYRYLGTDYRYYGPAIYPRLMALLLWFTNGSPSAMFLLQAGLFAAAGPVVYAIARLFVVPQYALAAGMLAICHPGNLIYSSKLHPHALDVLLISTTFLLLCRFTIRPTLEYGAAAGVMLGLALLSRGTIGSFAIAWAVWSLVHHRHNLSSGAANVAMTAVCAVIVVSPLLVSGYTRYGTLIPLRTDTGANLWIGNNPWASGTLVTIEEEPRIIQDLMPPALTDQLATMNEVEQNSALTSAALGWMAENPVQFTQLFAKKLSYFWWFAPSAGRTYPEGWKLIYAVYYAAILISGVIGIVYLFRTTVPQYQHLAMMFTLILVCYSMTQALFYVEGRHRWEIEPLLLVLAVVGITHFRATNRPLVETMP